MTIGCGERNFEDADNVINQLKTNGNYIINNCEKGLDPVLEDMGLTSYMQCELGPDWNRLTIYVFNSSSDKACKKKFSEICVGEGLWIYSGNTALWITPPSKAWDSLEEELFREKILKNLDS